MSESVDNPQYESNKNFFNYFLHHSTTPAIGFRVAQQPKTGLWNVYAIMRSENKPPLKPGEEPEPDPPECKPSEAIVARALRSLDSAKLCVANAEVCTTLGPFSLDKSGKVAPGQANRNAEAVLIWNMFENVVLREKSGGRYDTKLPVDMIAERGRFIMQNTLRTEPLERFGNIAITRRDIYSFEIHQLAQTITIYVRLRADITVCVPAISFTTAQKDEAEKALAEFIRRANSQVGDETIDFDDLEPLPIVQRRKERHDHQTQLDISATSQAQASSNIDDVTLDDVEEMARQRKFEEDDKEDDQTDAEIVAAVAAATKNAPVAGEEPTFAQIAKNGKAAKNGKHAPAHVAPAKVTLGKHHKADNAKKFLGQEPKMVSMKQSKKT